MKNIYLHIGTHKTGTSTIQQTLRHIHNKLQELDYCWVPESYLLYKKFTPEDINGVVAFLESLKTLPQSNFVFSSEGFSSGIEADIEIVKNKAEILKKILQDFNVKVILYLRRQDQYIESVYIQSIHDGGSYTFDEFINNIFDYKKLDWQKIIDIYIENFGRQHLIVRPYDKQLIYKNNINDDFFLNIGLKDKIKLKGFPHWNKSYSHQTLRIARYMNSILTSPEEKRKLRTLLQNISTKEVFEKHSFFSPAKRQEIIEYFNKSNTAISKKYFHQENNVFSLTDSDLKLPETETSAVLNEDIVEVMCKVFLAISNTDK